MVEHHAKGLAELAGGVRLATAAYLDELADAARTLGSASDRLRAEAEALTAQPVGRAGRPARPARPRCLGGHRAAAGDRQARAGR